MNYEFVRITKPKLLSSETPVGVFKIDEEIFIHYTDLLNVISGHKHRCSSNNIKNGFHRLYVGHSL